MGNNTVEEIPASEITSLSNSDNIENQQKLLTVEDKLRWGDNLASMLQRNNITPDEIEAILPVISEKINLRKIQAGTQTKMMFDDKGLKLLSIQEPGLFSRVVLNRTDSLVYHASNVEIEVDTVLVKLEGEIESSFYASFMEAGGNADLAIKYIDIFQYVFYFAFRTRSGDRYSMIAEELWLDGEKVGYGRILTANWEGSSDSLYAVWYPLDENGITGEYFDAEGVALRRDLLLLPFPTARVTSGFGYRFHPIKKKYRMHHGVDIAAKRGTPVVAAGAGQITQMGRNHAGYGNWVHVTHGKSGFETRYGHFQKIARGLRKGSWVKQGQVIGYVGSTGHATGPHLHYEVFRDTKRINPLQVKGSPVKKLSDEQLDDFSNNWYVTWMDLLKHPGALPSHDHFGPLPAYLAMK